MAVDGAILCGLVALLGWPGLVLDLAVVTAALAVFGQTPGKYAMRVKVERSDGGGLGPLRALARVVASMWLPLWVGLYALWSSGLPGLKESILLLARPEGVRAEVLIIASNSMLALCYLAGFLVAAISKERKTAHDWIAKTRVVHKSAAA